VLRFLGPGIIIASVTIGSGELVWASRSGAIFGYGMMWCFLYAGVFKAIQVYTAARHITLTGEHPLVAWCIPRRFPVFPLLIAVPAICIMPLAFSGIPEILGGFVHRLTGMSQEGPKAGPWLHLEFWINVWATIVLSACLALALSSSYKLLERVSTVVLALMVICVVIAVVTFGPNLLDVVKGLLVPGISEFPAWVSQKYPQEFGHRSPWLEVSLYLSAVGGGAYDYIGYVGMLREKKWGLAGVRVATRQELEDATDGNDPDHHESVRRGRVWQRAALLDTSISFFFVILVTSLFAILATLLLNEEQVVPANNDLLNEQERFLTGLHAQLTWVYRVGVFLAFVGTIYGAFEVYRHTFVESVRAMVPRFDTRRTLTLLGRGVIAFCFLGGLAMVWLPERWAGSVVDRFTLATIISGALACGLWCFAMLIADTIRLPKKLRMSLLLKIATLIAGCSMFYLGLQSMIAYFSG